MAENSKETINSLVPNLPVNKDFHIFMCYCSQNVNVVNTIVEKLEAEGFKCSFDARDFPAGERALDNMNKNITKSMYMVVILSEEFNGSPFCNHELEQALHMRVTEGYPIIPIKIEPCLVPSAIQHLTWINADNDDSTDIHSKIIDAITKRDGDSASNELKNGLTVQIPLTKERTRASILQRYSFRLSEADREHLRANNIQLPAPEMNTIEDIMQSSVLVKYQHIYKSSGRIMLLAFLIVCFCIPFTMFIQLSTLFGSNVESSRVGDTALSFTMYIGITSVCSGFLLHFSRKENIAKYCPHTNERRREKISNQQYQAALRIRKRLWEVNKHYMILGLLVMFNYNSLAIDVMKYDFRPCHRKFQKRCEQKEKLNCRRNEGETLEKYADRMFDWYLDSPSINDLRKPRPSSHTRHHMENGAPCLCLLVEEALSKST